ncbi:MAG: orotidine-5'-phosphate decarboxylase [Candidatus Pacebacteria bacterium CG10_big_fil_rev_8_21_14_0_10_56_10]|nr:MAG: orotidine-5'-phosphate decarboxylase [Candidatus Pacebacteria bacterium CG10_big_fil_rev_8_21_14_0_10_56_10]
MKFLAKLQASIARKKSNVCVGLDSRYDRIPDAFKNGAGVAESILAFNTSVISQTYQLAAAYKSNLAFYAGFGSDGLKGLELTNRYLRQHHSDIPVLADCKRSEMGASVSLVKQEIIEWLKFDCVMVTPWFGFDTVEDYLDDPQIGVCVYVHDSNPSAAEFQELKLSSGQRLYEYVAERVAGHWNRNGNVFVEAGATYPWALQRVRQIVGEEMVMLTAGVGAQGGKPEDLKGAFGRHGNALLVNSSRGIIFADDPAAAARELQKQLDRCKED